MTDDHSHERLQSTLDQILAEQKKTNGRVGRLEDESERVHTDLYGDKVRGVRGLVSKSLDAEQMVSEWRALRTAVLWLIGVLVTVAAPLVVAYITNGGG